MSERSFKELFDEARRHPDYRYEGTILEFTEALFNAMDEQGVSRAELARRLGTSQAYVTRVLRGNANFTLKTMNKLAFALGLELEVVLRPQARSTVSQPHEQKRAQ
jgi:transcriptional regulator with XRE-family HTH domain